VDVGDWLRELGLGQYEQAFREHAVDADTLPRLTSDDLKELGIQAIGHRRKLLDAIARLKGSTAGSVELRPTSAGQQHLVGAAERRRLTVLFCDLVNSTVLASTLDPEEYGDVLGAYRSICADTIGRFAGFLAKYMGDGVLAYFGYPQAHEDEASRAVRAGLALVDEVSRLTAPGISEPDAIRSGDRRVIRGPVSLLLSAAGLKVHAAHATDAVGTRRFRCCCFGGGLMVQASSIIRGRRKSKAKRPPARAPISPHSSTVGVPPVIRAAGERSPRPLCVLLPAPGETIRGIKPGTGAGCPR
jgi:hypothetical protein